MVRPPSLFAPLPLCPFSSDRSVADARVLYSPGRFFVASELKTFLAHLVLNYDIKMEKEGQVPPVRWFGTRLFVSRKAEVMFRERQT